MTEDFYELAERLETEGWKESSDRILEFSMKNNASVRIDDGKRRKCVRSQLRG